MPLNSTHWTFLMKWFTPVEYWMLNNQWVLKSWWVQICWRVSCCKFIPTRAWCVSNFADVAFPSGGKCTGYWRTKASSCRASLCWTEILPDQRVSGGRKSCKCHANVPWMSICAEITFFSISVELKYNDACKEKSMRLSNYKEKRIMYKLKTTAKNWSFSRYCNGNKN